MRSAVRFALAVAGAALAVSVAVPSAAESTADAALDPQAIFEKARAAWAFTSYPRYANYAVSVRYQNDGAAVTRRYDTLEDLRRNIIFAQAFSREEAANPSTPHGTNFGMLGATLNVAQADDPIGPLALAITYDFGISLAERPTQVAQLGSQITAPDRYPVIGHAGTVAHDYRVRLVDTPEGGGVDHLALTPLREPNHFRLREMWVDAQTFVTRKILISANFARKPYTEVPWLVTFVQIGGGPYIREERAQGTLDFGEAGTLSDVTIGFDEVQSAAVLPPYGSVGINGGAPEFLTEP